MTLIPEPEFSRVIQVNDIPDEGITLSVEATATEREALARRFGVVAIDSLTAEVSLHPERGRKDWQVDGRVLAEVVQTCVVTLNSIPVHREFSFKRIYAADIHDEARDDARYMCDIVLTLDQDDAPEPLVGGAVDLGEAVAEEFGLALDPFPRAADIVFDGYRVGPDDQRNTVNPFAALAERYDKIAKDKIEKKG